MRSSITIDKKHRVNLLKNEKIYKVLKAIKNNSKFETKVGSLILLDRNPYSGNKIRRRCAITGRGKGVYRRFKMSRIKVRENALQGNLACVRKMTW